MVVREIRTFPRFPLTPSIQPRSIVNRSHSRNRSLTSNGTSPVGGSSVVSGIIGKTLPPSPHPKGHKWDTNEITRDIKESTGRSRVLLIGSLKTRR